MNRAKAKSTAEQAGKTAGRETAGRESAGRESPGRKAADMAALREKIASMVSSEALQMVKTTMGEVDKGHYAAMKYLFDMVGLFQENTADPELMDGSLARTLLRRLGLPEEPEAGIRVTKDRPAESRMPRVDTVE